MKSIKGIHPISWNGYRYWWLWFWSKLRKRRGGRGNRGLKLFLSFWGETYALIESDRELVGFTLQRTKINLKYWHSIHMCIGVDVKSTNWNMMYMWLNMSRVMSICLSSVRENQWRWRIFYFFFESSRRIFNVFV